MSIPTQKQIDKVVQAVSDASLRIYDAEDGLRLALLLHRAKPIPGAEADADSPLFRLPLGNPCGKHAALELSSGMVDAPLAEITQRIYDFTRSEVAAGRL